MMQNANNIYRFENTLSYKITFIATNFNMACEKNSAPV